MHCHFLQDYKRSYQTAIKTWAEIEEEIKFVNHVIEFERNLQGQDDELPDDAWTDIDSNVNINLFKASH